MLILLGALDAFYVLLRLDARNHDLAAAAETADAKIHADAKHRKLVAAARVVLLHDELVAHSDIHCSSSFIGL